MRSSSWCSPRACATSLAANADERHPDHLGAALAHVDETLDHGLPRVEVARELRELGDRHALIADALDVQPRMEDREDEAKIARHRRLPGEHHLDLPLEREVAVVHLVVERDHLVAELDILGSQRVDRAADRTGHDLAGFLEAGFQRVELGLQLDPHPNLPVT